MFYRFKKGPVRVLISIVALQSYINTMLVLWRLCVEEGCKKPGAVFPIFACELPLGALPQAGVGGFYLICSWCIAWR